MTQWIYTAKKVDIDQVENSLADLGEAGWEAFAAYPHPNNSMWMIVALKKPKR